VKLFQRNEAVFLRECKIFTVDVKNPTTFEATNVQVTIPDGVPSNYTITTSISANTISKNVYGKTREECEEKPAERIKTMKAEIAEMKKQAKNT
jgi:hypothetical protein